MAYFCYIDEYCKELLFVKLLETDTTGLSIFEAVKSWFDENQVPFENLVSCAMDGAPSMFGKNKGIIVHCVAHCHHLVVKNISFDLQESLIVGIKTVNKILQ